MTLEWVHRAENLAAAGPSGTGKSHFVGALAHKAIDQGMQVAWFTLESKGRREDHPLTPRRHRRHRHAPLRPSRRRGVLPRHRHRLRPHDLVAAASESIPRVRR
ncbi:ATP-binding protein [Streptomyces sp. NPDC013172]|uniref:ATP-binding protein n=1 Tax=Streptomyces sp. NPDC013172 TaxID=3155009 RepID=UPI00340E1E99